jgi:hypothetical protein
MRKVESGSIFKVQVSVKIRVACIRVICVPIFRGCRVTGFQGYRVSVLQGFRVLVLQGFRDPLKSALLASASSAFQFFGVAELQGFRVASRSSTFVFLLLSFIFSK